MVPDPACAFSLTHSLVIETTEGWAGKLYLIGALGL